MKTIAVMILLFACVREFSWQGFTHIPGVAGSVQSIAQWPLIAMLCLSLALLSKNKWVSSACAATAIMALTSSACELAWLIDPWPYNPDDELCSKQWGVPMTLISAFVALATVARWRDDE